MQPGLHAVATLAASPVATVEGVTRPFDLEMMWHRGRFAPSLYAVSPARSRAWLDVYARDGLPMLSEINQANGRVLGGFWPQLALENGREEHGVQRRSGLKRAAFERLRSIAVQQDVLYRLPLWVPPSEVPLQEPLLYWTDSGVLNRHLGLTEETLQNWDASILPDERERKQLLRAKSWEGFVISCVLRAASIRAVGRVWQAPDGEIDLILEWSGPSSTWAIEVTLGRTKALTTAFAHGCDTTQARRRMVIFNSEVGKPRIKGRRAARAGVEWLSLNEALREVHAGP